MVVIKINHGGAPLHEAPERCQSGEAAVRACHAAN
jgi:hypothetical protein